MGTHRKYPSTVSGGPRRKVKSPERELKVMTEEAVDT
jgi:hypothetical protein